MKLRHQAEQKPEPKDYSTKLHLEFTELKACAKDGRCVFAQ